MNDRNLYFAYGSNMSTEQMASRCPDSVKFDLGILSNYKFIINSRGVASVIPIQNSSVEGIIWSISKKDEILLDRYEGVPKTYSRKEINLISKSSNNFVKVLIYIANDNLKGAPKNNYLEKIIISAKINQFSKLYQQELKKWTSGQNS